MLKPINQDNWNKHLTGRLQKYEFNFKDEMVYVLNKRIIV
jgi:hypothetical protein